MKPSRLLVLLLTAAALAPASRVKAAKPAPEAPTVVPAADVRLVTLKNGMRLLLAPDTAASAVDVAVWYRAGTVHERAGITGISHLFEHLMFAGSEHYGPQEHNRLVQAEGGLANAYTTPDYACYHQTIPPGALELVLKLEADRIASLKLTAAALEAEKRVVREEKRRRVEASPIGNALEGLGRLAWPAHPYRWPVLGHDEDLARISLADCQAYYDDHYAPNNATATIVGRFDPDRALQAAERWLGPLKRRRVANDAAHAAPAQRIGRRAFERMDVPFAAVLVGWMGPGHADPDSPALALLSRILVGGRASRLQCALTAEPLRCVMVQGALDDRCDGALLYALTVPRPGTDSARVERALVEEVEKLAREPVGEEELERVRRQEEIGTLLAWQTVRGCAEALGSAQIVEGDWRAAALRLERVRRLTPADLQRAAARVLIAGGRNVLWVAPAKPPAGVPAGSGDGGPGSGAPPAEGGR
jgi:predicted Zn-dependent peptidase